MKKTIMIMLALVAGLSSCSVKEDRLDCPCILSVDLSGIPSREQTLVLSIKDRGETMDMEVAPSEKPAVTQRVSKGFTGVSAVSGKRMEIISEDTLRITKGNEADSIFAYGDHVDCTAETAEAHVHLYKQFAVITLIMKDSFHADRLNLEIEGRYAGMDIYSLAPVSGTYRARLRQIDGDVFQVLVPRQGDDSLNLNLFVTDEDGTREQLISILPIGKSISEEGYDWNRKDLDDIRITIEDSSVEVKTEILPWKRVDLGKIIF